MLKVFAVVYSGGDSIDYLAAKDEQEAGKIAEDGWEEITEACHVRCGSCGALFPFDEEWEDERAPKMSRALIAAEYGHDCAGVGAGREHTVVTGEGTYQVTIRKAH